MRRRIDPPALRAGLAAVAAFACAATVALAAEPAFAGSTHGAYSWYEFGPSEGFDSVTFEVTVASAPGDEANVYWSNQFDFVGHSAGGYTGMQSNGDFDENVFLFSVWDAVEAKPGSEGSWCTPFGGEGEGLSCRYRHNWREGNRYQFELSSQSDGWFSVEVSNLDDDDAGFTLGSIRTSSQASAISPYGMVSWTEYFEWGATCTNQPFASAEFRLPATSPATPVRVNATNVAPACGDANSVTLTPTGSRQDTGIGYPSKGGSEKQPPARPTEPGPEAENEPEPEPESEPEAPGPDDAGESGGFIEGSEDEDMMADDEGGITASGSSGTSSSASASASSGNGGNGSSGSASSGNGGNGSSGSASSGNGGSGSGGSGGSGSGGSGSGGGTPGTPPGTPQAPPSTPTASESPRATDTVDVALQGADGPPDGLDGAPSRAPSEPTADSQFYSAEPQSYTAPTATALPVGAIALGAGTVSLMMGSFAFWLMLRRMRARQRKH